MRKGQGIAWTVEEDPWNPQHINQLPAEVRATVLAKCPTVPTAGH
jgi:hypothetical protein